MQRRRFVIGTFVCAAALASTLRSAAAGPSAGAALSYDRFIEQPGAASGFSHSTFLTVRGSGTLVTGAVFGLDVTLPLEAKSAARLPGFFAAGEVRGVGSGVVIDAAEAGMKMRLLGGTQSLSYESIGAPVWALYAFAPSPGSAEAGGLAPEEQLDAFGPVDGAQAPVARLLPYAGAPPAQTLAYPMLVPPAQGPAVNVSLPLGSPKTGFVAGTARWLELGSRDFSAVAPSGLTGESAPLSIARLGGRVGLNVNLFNAKATVSLAALWDRLSRTGKQSTLAAPVNFMGLDPTGNLEPPAPGRFLLLAPAYADVRQTLRSASASVPVTRALTANLSYVSQRVLGQGAEPQAQSINQRNTAVTTGFLYNFPNTKTSLNYFFTRTRTRDDALSPNGWVQNRQNLYFTVKF